jgi:hypothetical protein
MVYKEVKYEKSASIMILGDDEKIRIELRRGGSVEWSHEIHKNPGFFESIFPSYIDEIKMAPLFASKEQREKIFRSRIKTCMKNAGEWAQHYLNADNVQERKIKEKLLREKENCAKMDDFVTHIIEDMDKNI